MSSEITFTTAAFGGFEKKQVLDYIYKIHEEMDSERTSHQKRLNEISISFKELEARAIHSEKTQQKLQIDLTDALDKLDAEARLKDEYKIINEELRMKLEQSERIIEQRKNQEEALRAELNSLIDIEHAKQKTFVVADPVRTVIASVAPEDHITPADSAAALGRVMLEAHAKASIVIDDAKSEADKIIKDAKFTIEQIRILQQQNIDEYRDNAEKIANQMLASANEKAAETLTKSYSFAKSMMNEISTATNTATNNFMTINEQVAKLASATGVMQQSAQSDFIKLVNFPKVTIPVAEYSITLANPKDYDMSVSSYNIIDNPNDNSGPLVSEDSAEISLPQDPNANYKIEIETDNNSGSGYDIPKSEPFVSENATLEPPAKEEIITAEPSHRSNQKINIASQDTPPSFDFNSLFGGSSSNTQGSVEPSYEHEKNKNIIEQSPTMPMPESNIESISFDTLDEENKI